MWKLAIQQTRPLLRTASLTTHLEKNDKVPKNRIFTDDDYIEYHKNRSMNYNDESFPVQESDESVANILEDFKLLTDPSIISSTKVQPVPSATANYFPGKLLTMVKNIFVPKTIRSCRPPDACITSKQLGLYGNPYPVIPLCMPQYFVFANDPSPLSRKLIGDMVPRVAFSFAGEMRNRVEAIFNHVNTHEQLKGHVFYDNSFLAQLAVPNLDQELFKLYGRATLVATFLSSTYHKKPWCNLEWSSIYRRRYEDGNRLMLIKLEDFDHEALALPKGDGYIDATRMSNEEVAILIVKRFNLLISSYNNRVQCAAAMQ